MNKYKLCIVTRKNNNEISKLSHIVETDDENINQLENENFIFTYEIFTNLKDAQNRLNELKGGN